MQPDEFTLEIDGVEFRYWSDLTFSRVLDGVDSWTFSAPFEPETQAGRDAWRPLEFQPCKIKAGGVTQSVGVVVNITPSVSADSKTVEVTCYALCGLWQNYMPPAGTSLQFDGLKLDKIAQALAEPFGFSVRVEGDVGSKFDKAALDVGSTPWGFLVDLAQQRGMIITSDESGNALFYVPEQSPEVVARLDGNDTPVLGVSFKPDGQSYYSEITGWVKPKTGRGGSKFTEANSTLTGKVLPMSYQIDDTEPADAPKAVKAKLARMFAGAASYSVELATALDAAENGSLYQPDTRISLRAPDAMIYRRSEFTIREVVINATPNQTPTSSLNITLPGAFSGVPPETLPWQE